MFKNRKITVTVDKKNTDQTPEEPSDPKAFEKNAKVVLRHLESIGKKAFVGVCIYVLLDTYRQVKVAKATDRPDDQI